MYIYIHIMFLSSLNLTEHGVIIPHLEHTPNHKGKNLLAVPWIQSICRSKNISWYLRCVFSECTPSWYHLVFIWYSYGITWYHMAHGIWHHMVSLAYGIVLVLSLSIIPLPWHRRSHDGYFDGAHTSADGGMFRSRQLLGCRGVAVQGKPQTVWCWGSWADRPLKPWLCHWWPKSLPFEPEVRDSATRD